MMKKLSGGLLLLAALALAASPALAAEKAADPRTKNVAVVVQLGTLGLSGGIVASLGSQVNIRVAGSGVALTRDATVSDIKYDFDINLYTAGLFLDWHPGGAGFRVSLGIIANNNKFEADATPSATSTYTLGGVTYPGAALGKLHADADMNPVAPYFGIGYGNALSSDGRWQFQFDLGVMYWGSPDVTLTSSNSNLAPGLQDSLNAEAKKVEDDLDMVTFYPVLMIGVSYAF